MLVLHDRSVLSHRTIEIFSGKSFDALECPERIQVIVDAIKESDHELQAVSVNEGHESESNLVHSLISETHDAAYLEHLRTIHEAWVRKGIIELEQSVMPECFNVPGLKPKSHSEQPPRDLNARPGYFAFDLSTGISQHTWAAAVASANLAVEGARMIVAGGVTSQEEQRQQQRDILALTRPPGHHCTTKMAGGYCYINNAVVGVQAIRHLAAASTDGTKSTPSVAILDLDFHHGNGTQSYFYEDASVLYVSIHGEDEYPYYTGSADEEGDGSGKGFNLNLPLSVGSSSAAYLEKLDTAIRRLQEFKPQYLLLSLGFDTYFKDSLGAFDIKSPDYRRIAARVREAEGLREVPSLILLEGGYVLEDLGQNMLEFLAGWQ